MLKYPDSRTCESRVFSIYGQVSRTFVLITHTNYLHYLVFSSCLDKLFSINSYSIYLYLHRLSPQPVLFASFLCLVISATNGSLHSHRSFFHIPPRLSSSSLFPFQITMELDAPLLPVLPEIP